MRSPRFSLLRVAAVIGKMLLNGGGGAIELVSQEPLVVVPAVARDRRLGGKPARRAAPGGQFVTDLGGLPAQALQFGAIHRATV